MYHNVDDLPTKIIKGIKQQLPQMTNSDGRDALIPITHTLVRNHVCVQIIHQHPLFGGGGGKKEERHQFQLEMHKDTDSFLSNANTIYFKLKSRNGLLLEHFKDAVMRARFTKQEKEKWISWPVIPTSMEPYLVGSDDDDDVDSPFYYVFPTHQLKLRKRKTKDTSLLVVAIYFTLCNDAMMRKVPSDVHLALHLDMETLFLEPRFGDRYIGLDYVPFDANPDVLLKQKSISDIPQHTPIWFDARGVGGRKSVTLLGYYVPSKNTLKGRNWSIDDPPTFSLYTLALMRFGTIHEDLGVGLYLLMHPNVCFRERGWCRMPDELRLPSDWGSSPDGELTDSTMTWERIPENERNLLKNRAWDTPIDITRGGLEIKCSKGKTKKTHPRGEHLVQMSIMMMALHVAWSDILYLHRELYRDPNSGKWVKRFSAWYTRFYRHMECEQLLIKCLLEAIAEKRDLQTVITRPHFIKLRLYFDTMAQTQLEIIHIDIDNNPDAAELIEDFYKARNITLSPSSSPPLSQSVWNNWHTQLDNIESNHIVMHKDASAKDAVIHGLLQLQKEISTLLETITTIV